MHFIICILLLIADSIQAAERLKEYIATRDLAVTILAKYPPSEYHYVGIGRSPTPLVAFFQEIDPNLARNLPLSAFNGIPGESPYAAEKKPYSAETEKKLFAHFDRFLPTEKELQGKKILFLDYSSFGTTIVSATEYLKAFGKKFRPGVPVRTFAFQGADFTPDPLVYDVADTVQLPDDVLSESMGSALFEPNAEYPQFNIENNDSRLLVPRPEYAAYRKKFQHHMSRDPELLRALKEMKLIHRFPAGISQEAIKTPIRTLEVTAAKPGMAEEIKRLRAEWSSLEGYLYASGVTISEFSMGSSYTNCMHYDYAGIRKEYKGQPPKDPYAFKDWYYKNLLRLHPLIDLERIRPHISDAAYAEAVAERASVDTKALSAKKQIQTELLKHMEYLSKIMRLWDIAVFIHPELLKSSDFSTIRYDMRDKLKVSYRDAPKDHTLFVKWYFDVLSRLYPQIDKKRFDPMFIPGRLFSLKCLILRKLGAD